MSRFAFTSTLAIILFFAFFAAFTSAAPTSAAHSGTATWYEVGQGACGDTDNDSEFIVALAQPDWDTSYCNKQVSITNSKNGKTATAIVRDMCPGCASGDLDTSPSLFDALDGNLNDGTCPITWNYV